VILDRKGTGRKGHRPPRPPRPYQELVALPLGFVDVKVCAVDAVGSGLKLVVRRQLR